MMLKIVISVYATSRDMICPVPINVEKLAVYSANGKNVNDPSVNIRVFILHH